MGGSTELIYVITLPQKKRRHYVIGQRLSNSQDGGHDVEVAL